MPAEIVSSSRHRSAPGKAPETPPKPLRTLALRVNGDPLDPDLGGSFIKPAELVDAIEISPLNRSELVLYNQLLANAWNDIGPGQVHRIRKASLRGSHDSNDRLHEAFDRLMGAFAKVRHRDPETGRGRVSRISLLGPNTEEESEDGYFYYSFHASLLAILEHSQTWARLKSEIMYMLRSKYSIRLYEIVERRINMRTQGEYFTPDELRALLGVPKNRLKRFADFNKHCLKPAVAEINQITDYVVSIGAIRRGRSIERLHLVWMKKDAQAVKEAAAERARSSIGRAARRKSRIEIVA